MKAGLFIKIALDEFVQTLENQIVRILDRFQQHKDTLQETLGDFKQELREDIESIKKEKVR